MKILIVAATAFEIAPILKFLEANSDKKSFFEFHYRDDIIYPLVTGVGSVLTAFNLGRFQNAAELDLVVNLGLAGSFRKEIKLGDVISVERDRFADLGVEEKNESFTDVFELDLIDKDQFPFEDGWIKSDALEYFHELKTCKAITVNRVHGSEQSIQSIIKKYDPDIESMEGAAFSYAAKMMNLEYIQIRAISNFVEPRNKDSWKIDIAINNLSDSFVYFLENHAL